MGFSDFAFTFNLPAGDNGLKATIESLESPNTLLLLVISLSLVVVSPYVKHVVSTLRPGLPRFCAALPVLAFNILAAAAVNSEEAIVQKFVLLFVFSWLANFKLLAFCLNRGPLVGPWTTLQLAAILNQPIYPRPHRDTLKKDDAQLSGRLQDHGGHTQVLLFRWMREIGIFAACTYIIFNFNLTPLTRDLLQVAAVYCFVAALMDGPAAVLTRMLDFDIIPTFDQPWLSVSMADFWGRRWNVTTSHLLRVIVYDPIAEGRLVRDPKVKVEKSQNFIVRATGLCCTFLVSGIVHEIILWALQPDGRVSWKWLIFFTIQGPLMIIEHFIVDFATARGWQLNVWVARFLTQSFVMMMGHYLFFYAACSDTDTFGRINKASHHGFELLLAAVKRQMAAAAG